ncbi:bifunctional diaminohydroxyphosphoribosylaminopyrimidine deaminase/5-amino-6-(5-phosphoribosylamino)uracil reductase RibD [Luteococcus peritonei]|uniref:Riboflavin biosynthesis protein RibD n=1 Tax=Luteococcus peritonei TaxID=88874 RepID=A0ABW4RRT4_9ACTN
MHQPTIPHQTDHALMAMALELARQGPEADPNPRVGCVLATPDGEVVGRGWHRGAGTAHAEVVALQQAGAAARGATAYVTLEPCDHTGRTGPCSHALVAAGISRVVHAQHDPNPVAAGGAERLRRAGLVVEGGLLADRAHALNRTWTHLARHGRPFVTWKFAATLDGRSAAADGSSQWITGAALRARVGELRSRCGAVVVGSGTLQRDDPRLTARDAAGELLQHQPLRAVMGLAEVPGQARVRGADGRFRHLATRDPQQALTALAAEGVHHVWLEGGPRLAAAFWRAGLVDEVLACLAPVLLGAGTAAVADLGIAGIEQAARLRLERVEQVEQDLLLVLRPRADGDPAPPEAPRDGTKHDEKTTDHTPGLPTGQRTKED